MNGSSSSDEKREDNFNRPPRIQKVLISGAGISGQVVAYWLAKAGFSVTILERADSVRTGGHTISLLPLGVEVLNKMGLADQLPHSMTNQAGLKFLDTNNRTHGSFPLQGDGVGFTSAAEFLRSQLAGLIYSSTQSTHIDYVFGDVIDSIEETESSVCVTMANGKSKCMEYDILIVAEGVYSQTRAKIFNEEVQTSLKTFDQWLAWFSYEAEDLDDRWGYWYHVPNRPPVVIRPDGVGKTRVLILGLSGKTTEFLTSPQVPLSVKRKYLIGLYEGTGWQSDKVLEGLRKADDLYFQQLTQTKCPTWSKGRAVLVGDCAYCPSALTGLGTTTALVGAYILAAEIVQHRTDHQAAFSAYEEFLREPMERAQILPAKKVWIGCPESSWRIFLLHIGLRVISSIQRTKAYSYFARIQSKLFPPGGFDLPDPSIFLSRQS